MSDTRTSPLIFGIYPGGSTGFGSGRAFLLMIPFVFTKL